MYRGKQNNTQWNRINDSGFIRILKIVIYTKLEKFTSVSMCMYTRVVGTKIVVSVYFCVFLSFQIVRKTPIESSIAAAICRIDGVRLK